MQLDMNRDQFLMSIRQAGILLLGYVEIKNGKLVTSGIVGDNEYDNFVELIRGLQGFDIKIDDFYF